jgi:hypothetical protein
MCRYSKWFRYRRHYPVLWLDVGVYGAVLFMQSLLLQYNTWY